MNGWWFEPTPLKNDGVKVSWDDDIPNNPNFPNHHNTTCSEDMKNLKQV